MPSVPMIVPRDTFSVGGPIQPCPNPLAYRTGKDRVPVPFHNLSRDEEALYITLFAVGQEETQGLESAVKFVQSAVRAGSKVQPACVRAMEVYSRYAAKFGWKLKTFRALYDRWCKAQDWTVLVNKAQAPKTWRDADAGLPERFLTECVAVYFGRKKRWDGRRQAVLAIHRWWESGRDLDDKARPVPGYEVLPDGSPWAKRNPAILPVGWSYENIMRQMKGRNKWNNAVRALLHEGTPAAKDVLPQIHGTRRDLRFLEEVTFDDVRTDFLIMDNGETCELWLLVARDTATAMVLGFVPHVSRRRKDGSVSHLGLKEAKQLFGFILERYPLPPYICTWKVERGTMTISEGDRAMLQEMLPNRIRVSYTSMIGGKSPTGFAEKRKGNSRGKASHESHNRLFHTQAAHLPGQTGAHYEIRPADLDARCDAAVEQWGIVKSLPAHIRRDARTLLCTLEQACEHLFRFCVEQNFRKAHSLENFETVMEWYDPAAGKWRHQAEYDATTCPAKIKTKTRMEMPVERAIRLMAGYTWERVSPVIVRAFYEHTAAQVTINPKGEVVFKNAVYLPPVAGPRQEMKCLAYAHPHDPEFLYLSHKGAIVGVWIRRDRVRRGDQEALAQAMRYTDAALKAVQDYANNLAAAEREQIETDKAHNALLADSVTNYIDVANNPAVAGPRDVSGEITSPVAAALAEVSHERDTIRTERKDVAQAAAADILNGAKPTYPAPEPSTAAADDLLNALTGH